MRTLGLDFGEARVGVAVSDPTGQLAQPLEAVARRAALQRIRALVEEYEVERVVVGLPLRMDGSSGPQAERARAFGTQVGRQTGLPVEYVDERWTSLEARRVLQSGGVKARRQKGRVDPIAAALILQTWMDRAAS